MCIKADFVLHCTISRWFCTDTFIPLIPWHEACKKQEKTSSLRLSDREKNLVITLLISRNFFSYYYSPSQDLYSCSSRTRRHTIVGKTQREKSRRFISDEGAEEHWDLRKRGLIGLFISSMLSTTFMAQPFPRTKVSLLFLDSFFDYFVPSSHKSTEKGDEERPKKTSQKSQKMQAKCFCIQLQ